MSAPLRSADTIRITKAPNHVFSVDQGMADYRPRGCFFTGVCDPSYFTARGWALISTAATEGRFFSLGFRSVGTPVQSTSSRSRCSLGITSWTLPWRVGLCPGTNIQGRMPERNGRLREIGCFGDWIGCKLCPIFCSKKTIPRPSARAQGVLHCGRGRMLTSEVKNGQDRCSESKTELHASCASVQYGQTGIDATCQ